MAPPLQKLIATVINCLNSNKPIKIEKYGGTDASSYIKYKRQVGKTSKASWNLREQFWISTVTYYMRNRAASSSCHIYDCV